jgi:mitotic spindle assembly checkpoint protein MAD1
MAKAFMQERLERLTLLDKLGSVQPELSVKDETIRSLQEERIRLQTELKELRSSSTNSVGKASDGDAKAKARLERQKNLLIKEVEYLRAQMKTFEAEEAEFAPEQVDEARLKRVHELEETIDQYRNEVQTLQADLTQLESHPATTTPPTKKRARPDSDSENEHVGELQRRARTLQNELEALHKHNQLLEAELRARTSQLTSLQESSRTRVLELRSNPTADFAAIKLRTLTTLRDENAALLARLADRASPSPTVPAASLADARLQNDELRARLAQQEKKESRLKQIWGAKSLEFREAVCSVLGWKLDFLPNGRVKATSILYPTQAAADGEELENSIVFDGENGTMKVSGGPRSVFAGEIRGLIEFWVEGRKEIPCFLAACTLEFYDKTTRAQKM